MADMKEFVPQAAIDASIASVQRIAMAIVAQPKALRAESLATVRRAYEETANRFGGIEFARTWADLQVRGIEALIKKIEASGGALGGHA
jgi:hypothetical protein